MKNADKKKSTFRKVVRQLHLILGLASGLVVFVVAVTGCLWVFQEEIRSWSNDLPAVRRLNSPVIAPLEARRIAETALPGRHVHGTLYDADERQPVEVIFYEAEPEFYQSVFLHPYTGEVFRIDNKLEGFFPFVLDGHMHLWLPEGVGSEIVAWGTVIFVVMLISGMVLWWPRKKKGRRQRFWFRWKDSTAWKRKNFDLHAIAGFYVFAVALIIAFSGLIMTFEAFEEFTYNKVLGGDRQTKFVWPASTGTGAATADELAPIDRLLPLLREKFPHALDFEVHYPFSDTASIYVELGYEDGVYYSADYRFFDQHTLEEVETPSIYGRYAEAGFSEKVMRMNYDTHVGAIGGLPGKILAFIASFVCASLPVSGVLIYWGRKRKKKDAASAMPERKTERPGRYLPSPP